MAQDNIFGQVANNVERFAMAQYGVDLKNEQDQRDFAQTGAMNSFITGRVMEPLNAQQITPQQAMEAINKEAQRIGLNPKTALQMFSVTMDNSAKAAQAKGQSLSNLLKIQKAEIDAAKAGLAVEKEKQAAFLKSPEGIEETRVAKEVTPEINAAVSVVKEEIDRIRREDELQLTDIEGLVDELGDDMFPELENFVGANITNKADKVAEIIASKIIAENPVIGSSKKSFTTVKGEVLKIILGEQDPQKVDTIKKNEPAVGLFHG